MRKTTSKRPINVMMILILFVSFALIVAAVSMLMEYSKEMTEQSSSEAALRTANMRQAVEESLNQGKIRVSVIADTASEKTTENALKDYLSDVGNLQVYDIFTIRYYKGDDLYEYTGDEVLTFDGSRAIHEQRPTEARYVGSFDEELGDGTMSIVGFYAPIKGSPVADAVVVYYARHVINSFFPEEKIADEAEISVLCTANCEIIGGRWDKTIPNIGTILRGKIGEKAPIDEMKTLMYEGKNGIIPVSIGGEDYLISVGADKIKMQDLCVVELYRAKDLYSSSFDFIDTIIGIFILFAIVAICVVAYLMIHRAKLRREFLNLETMDKTLSCLNRHGFEKEATPILERNKASYFAVVVFQLRHFKYLLDTYGGAEVDLLLSHLRMICAKTVQIEELYGHAEEGQFLMLLHAKDQKDLIGRLKIHASRASQYKGSHAYDVILKYGIYERDRNEVIPISQMIDYANEANNSNVRATVQNATMQFNFYNDEVRKIRLLSEDMELRMEGALKNGEFQVFYQAKYNLNHDKQDGAEALVRWYDPKTKEFNRPALFMPLFESNGFIVKLDKYVFLKVCEYISYSIANGRSVFPVSVNVSRITAVQPDFIEYYSKTKKKFGISDGQIMIEFTESFAYENYETLESIVDNLHKNGFKCSIDDFGCGYSSYRILKSLPMDEIKLDKFFLEKGHSDDRDQHIFESIISLAKKLGMKVTQEGVETEEDIIHLRDLHCDVIQGYYYSRPIPLSDYLNFVANTREHDLKNIR